LALLDLAMKQKNCLEVPVDVVPLSVLPDLDDSNFAAQIQQDAVIL
jgi:hypothetical protein